MGHTIPVQGDSLETPMRAAIPRDPEQAIRAAAALGLTIPTACLPGVTTNLALLACHAELFRR